MMLHARLTIILRMFRKTSVNLHLWYPGKFNMKSKIPSTFARTVNFPVACSWYSQPMIRYLKINNNWIIDFLSIVCKTSEMNMHVWVILPVNIWHTDTTKARKIITKWNVSALKKNIKWLLKCKGGNMA